MNGQRLDGTPKNFTVKKSGLVIPSFKFFQSDDMAARYIFRKLGIEYVRDDETNCYGWPLAHNEMGYPVIYWDGTVQPVARWLMNQIRQTPLPRNVCPSHTFGWPDIRSCVRPTHYELVPKAENIRRTMALYGRIKFKTSKRWDQSKVKRLRDYVGV